MAIEQHISTGIKHDQAAINQLLEESGYEDRITTAAAHPYSNDTANTIIVVPEIKKENLTRSEKRQRYLGVVDFVGRSILREENPTARADYFAHDATDVDDADLRPITRQELRATTKLEKHAASIDLAQSRRRHLERSYDFDAMDQQILSTDEIKTAKKAVREIEKIEKKSAKHREKFDSIRRGTNLIGRYYRQRT